MMWRRFAFTVWMSLVGAAGCAGGGTGGCPEPCASTQVCCDGRCVFTQIDVNHCGGCGNMCNGTCGGGVCTPSSGFDAGPRPDSTVPNNCRPECSSTQRCCGTSCVDRSQTLNVDGRPGSAMDPRSTFNNCNACGLQCNAERAISCSIRAGGTTPECACGDFAECLSGEVCANQAGRWQCVNLSTNPQNCGEIGNVCAEGEICQTGDCVCGSTGGRCGEGQSCCGGACIDTSSDPANCGGCGTVCGGGETCQDGACVCGSGPGARVCTAPSTTSLGESCCGGSCVANSPSSCGCVACDSDAQCIFGSGLMGGANRLCCSPLPAFPGLPAFCLDLPGLGDGGLPGLGDGGLPFP
jgi:hypothetical protein